MNRDDAYLLDIAEAIRLICKFLGDMTESEFYLDEKPNPQSSINTSS